MKQTEEIIEIEDMNTALHLSVHTYIREHNAKIAEKTVVEERFKEFVTFVDTEARRTFKYPTTSMLKCSYGFNHYSNQDVLINKYWNNKCLLCGATETWEHVIRCREHTKERKLWLN